MIVFFSYAITCVFRSSILLIISGILFRITCSTLLSHGEIITSVCFCVQHVTDIFVFFVDTTDARDFVAYTG